MKGKAMMDVDQTPGYLTARHASSLLNEVSYTHGHTHSHTCMPSSFPLCFFAERVQERSGTGSEGAGLIRHRAGGNARTAED